VHSREIESIRNRYRLALLLLALLAFEKPPQLLSNALHDLNEMLVRRMMRICEEFQDGLELSFCVERKAEAA
jgi:hypothetical protein